jgi:uncharacterized protein
MTWITTYAGRDHSLLPGDTLQPGELTYKEVAHSLAHINRYSGHTSRPYSVAEHSLLCASIANAKGASPAHQLCVLMHDAHECITGDVTSPVKQMIGPTWHTFETDIQQQVLNSFGLYAHFMQCMELVKWCDLTALASERAALLEYHPARNRPWPAIDTPGATIKPWNDANLHAGFRHSNTPAEWATHFHRRAMALEGAMHKQPTTTAA